MAVKKFDEFINESEFWGSEASGILPIAKDTGRILIGLRSEGVNEPLTWGNFGGAIGLNDWEEEEEALAPNENAVKEMQEEIGYHGNIKLIASYIFSSDNFKYYNFLGIVPNEHDINPSNSLLNWEVDELKWVTLDELLNHEDLHFGLQGLLDNATSQIRQYAK